MSLGDVYGKVNKSGNDSGYSHASRSSEDGTPERVAAPTGAELKLKDKQREMESLDREVTGLKRELVNADLHKTPDGREFMQIKERIEGKLRQIDEHKRRLHDEIHRLETNLRIQKHI